MIASQLTDVIHVLELCRQAFYIVVVMKLVITQQNRLHANAVTTFKTFFYLSLMSLTVSNVNKKLTISYPPPTPWFKFNENPFGM
jgi:hypothetical protein